MKFSLLCLTLCDPMDCTGHGILQAKILEWVAIPVLLPGKSHGQRSLEGYSPWGHKESDTTERLNHHQPHVESTHASLI